MPMTNLGVRQKLVPMILWLKVIPKIRNLNKIQYTYGMAEGDDITDTIIPDNLLPIKKVRWKDIAETNSAEFKFTLFR